MSFSRLLPIYAFVEGNVVLRTAPRYLQTRRYGLHVLNHVPQQQTSVGDPDGNIICITRCEFYTTIYGANVQLATGTGVYSAW